MMWKSSCSGNTQKLNVQHFFLKNLWLQGSRFSETRPHQRDVVENWIRLILKKLVKMDACFHDLTKVFKELRNYCEQILSDQIPAKVSAFKHFIIT